MTLASWTAEPCRLIAQDGMISPVSPAELARSLGSVHRSGRGLGEILPISPSHLCFSDVDAWIGKVHSDACIDGWVPGSAPVKDSGSLGDRGQGEALKR